MGIGDMLQAERDAEDAKRYRWLRNESVANSGKPFIATFTGSFAAWAGERADEIIDAAIDSARTSKGEQT